MAIQLPPGLDEPTWTRALSAFEGVVGSDGVLSSDLDRENYKDMYAPAQTTTHLPSATVVPASVEELQDIVRLANEYKTPLWTVARGKNLGYGSSAPVMSGSVVLDLSRMKRIIDVDPKQASCLVEPGVGFFDLYNYLEENKIPLWMSIPSQAWGSVVGNALDRGSGYTPYGEHSSQICGMEVVLPTGELVRTGSGAMSNNKSWQNFRNGFGPGWDQMFCQSNFGVVSKMGLWMMPAPESTLTIKYDLQKPEDIIWALDVLADLRLRRIIDSHVTIGTPIRTASLFSQRSDWYDGDDAIPEDVVQKMMKDLDVGYWTFSIRLFGYEDVLKLHGEMIKSAFNKHSQPPTSETWWYEGEELPKFSVNVPTTYFLKVANWLGGRGAHTDFSPTLPLDGQAAYDQYVRVKRQYDKHNIDLYFGFTLAERYITNVNMVIYDRDNPAMFQRATALFDDLTKEAKEAGYGSYRTHLDFMDDISATYDFNDNALLKINEQVKDTLDPNGILAPGKSGIWPKRYRENG